MLVILGESNGLKEREKSLGKYQDYLQRCIKKGDPELINGAESLVKEYENNLDDYVKRIQEKRKQNG